MVNYYYYQSQTQDLKIPLVVFKNTDASHHALKKNLCTIYIPSPWGRKKSS